MLKILILVSSINTGDYNQAEALINAFAKTGKNLEYLIIDAKQEYLKAGDQYQKEVSNIKEKFITLAIGEDAMNLLVYLTKANLIDPNKSYTCLSIHQFFSSIEGLKLNQLIIPESTIDKQEEKNVINKIAKVTYIFTPITNNPLTEELGLAFEEWSDKPDLSNKYIVVMLPGDAPDSNNKIRYFTKESAFKLFRCVQTLLNKLGSEYKVIVENGPRTGKHDPITGEVVSKHEYLKGESPEKAIDPISSYFVTLLKDNNIIFNFYNFATEISKDERKTISYFKPLLYLAMQPNNYFVLPGASVSLMGQVPLYLQSDKIILFKSSSMNEDHINVANLAYQKNYLSYFDDNFEVVSAKEISKRYEDDLDPVVKDIYHSFEHF